jgi:twinkle protein
MALESESETAKLTHQPCDDCGSSDALAVYDDHTFCFSCEAHTWLHDRDIQQSEINEDLIPVGDFRDIPARGLTEAICRKFGYSVSQKDGRTVQVAAYRNQSNQVVAQKIRPKNKDFMHTVGPFKNLKLFGQHLWKPGKRLVITEGEIDALSYAQATNGRWPVVSISTGAASATRAIKTNLEFVEGFQEVVLLFDMDDAGQEAAEKVADLLTPGKCAIAQLPLKDANEMLVAGRVKELVESVWQAEPRRPDGIINGKEIWNEVSQPIRRGVEYPWTAWNHRLYGIRPREIVTLTAGSGVGKSTLCAEIAYRLGTVENSNVGYIALEEGLGRTGQRLMSLAAGHPMHLPGEITEADRRKAFDETLGTGRFFLYDHFGSLDSDNLLRKLTYMVTALDVKYLILDHLSILVSGMDQDALANYGDERKAIDYTMTQLRSFTERTNASLFVVSHLRRVGGDKGHEGGDKVYLSHLRGSQAIAQLSDAVVSISRDMSSGENRIEVNCLKNRYAGMTGPMGTLEYDPATGRLLEVIEDFDDAESDFG